MNIPEKIVIANQLRKHHKPTIMGSLRRWQRLHKCKSVGQEVIVDKNVKIMRYPENVSIKNNVILKEGVRICSTNSNAIISVGERTTIGYYTMIFSTYQIEIGNDCLIAPFCYVIDSNHQIRRNKLINTQPLESQKIVIEDDVWLGNGVKVLSGVTIAKGAVVAANSVVNQDVPSYDIYGGSPAKKNW